MVLDVFNDVEHLLRGCHYRRELLRSAPTRLAFRKGEDGNLRKLMRSKSLLAIEVWHLRHCPCTRITAPFSVDLSPLCLLDNVALIHISNHSRPCFLLAVISNCLALLGTLLVNVQRRNIALLHPSSKLSNFTSFPTNVTPSLSVDPLPPLFFSSIMR